MAKRKWGSFTVGYHMLQAFDNGLSEVESLRDEMEQWRDNMEGTGLENTEKFERVSEAADYLEDAMSALENVRDARPENSWPEILLQYQEVRKKHMPRHLRLSNAITALEAVVSAMEDYEEPDDTDDDHGIELFSDLVGELADAISNLENIEFPGMFG